MKHRQPEINRSGAILLLTCLLLALYQFESCSHSTDLPEELSTDTTGHDFAWTAQELGSSIGSYFADVAIVNDSLAFAVGRVHVTDTLGDWHSDVYSLARWDGKRWELRRVRFVAPCVVDDYPALHGIWAFSENNILLVSGSTVAHFDGVNAVVDCDMTDVLTGQALDLFAVTPNEYYVGGLHGMIIHYRNGSWQTVQSGTTLPIQKIWGARDRVRGSLELLAVAGDRYAGNSRRILAINGNRASILPDSGITQALNSIWFIPGVCYYAAGGEVYLKDVLNQVSWRDSLDRQIADGVYKFAIRGNAANDVFVAGELGNLLHYNGASWKNFRAVTGIGSGSYLALAVKGDLVIAVGEESGRAVAAVGKRIQ